MVEPRVITLSKPSTFTTPYETAAMCCLLLAPRCSSASQKRPVYRLNPTVLWNTPAWLALRLSSACALQLHTHNNNKADEKEVGDVNGIDGEGWKNWNLVWCLPDDSALAWALCRQTQMGQHPKDGPASSRLGHSSRTEMINIVMAIAAECYQNALATLLH